MTEPEIVLSPSEKIIYKLDCAELPEKYKIYNNVPDKYVVVESAEANSGCYVLGLYNNEWVANAGSRYLINHLIKELEKEKGK
jgi:hypothetical protein